GDREADNLARSPLELVSSPGRHEDERADRSREEPGAEVVDAMPVAHDVEMELQRDDRDSDRTDGQVHVEDPAPREVVDEEAAEQRPRDRRDAEDRPDEAHVAAPLSG